MRDPVLEFTTLDSTNLEAHRRAAAGERGPLWLRADRQETGRGRAGRGWSSPAGNLAATLLFRPHCDVRDLHQLSLVAGVAACAAVADALAEAGSARRCRLKWPNDLMIDGAKVGGILVESSIYSDDIVAIIGCGINLAISPAVEGRQITSVSADGPAPSPRQFLAVVDDCLKRNLTLWNRGAGFADIREAWLLRSYPRGEPMTVNTNTGRVWGTFAGLDDDGALLLQRSPDRVQRFQFGDVTPAATVAKPADKD